MNVDYRYSIVQTGYNVFKLFGELNNFWSCYIYVMVELQITRFIIFRNQKVKKKNSMSLLVPTSLILSFDSRYLHTSTHLI